AVAPPARPALGPRRADLAGLPGGAGQTSLEDGVATCALLAPARPRPAPPSALPRLRHHRHVPLGGAHSVGTAATPARQDPHPGGLPPAGSGAVPLAGSLSGAAPGRRVDGARARALSVAAAILG